MKLSRIFAISLIVALCYRAYKVGYKDGLIVGKSRANSMQKDRIRELEKQLNGGIRKVAKMLSPKTYGL